MGFLNFLDPVTSVANTVTSIIDNNITRQREDNALQRKAQDAIKAGLSPTSAILGGQGAQAQALQTTPMDTSIGRGTEANDIAREGLDVERERVQNERFNQLENLHARENELEQRIKELENSKAQSEADRRLLAQYQSEQVRLQEEINRISDAKQRDEEKNNAILRESEREKRVYNAIMGIGDEFVNWSWSDSKGNSSSYNFGTGNMYASSNQGSSDSKTSAKSQSGQQREQVFSPLEVYKRTPKDAISVLTRYKIDTSDLYGVVGDLSGEPGSYGGCIFKKDGKYYLIRTVPGGIDTSVYKNDDILKSAWPNLTRASAPKTKK